MEFRTGFGVDIHRFEKGDGFLLGGVFIPCEKKIVAHSDGDVIYHALAQAIFSALGEDDIGTFFPDNKIETLNLNSLIIVNKALEIMKEKGFSLNNINIALILEAPKLKDYKAKIKESLSDVLSLDLDRISIHAGTAEKIGDLGREEGILCYASLSLRKD